MTQAAATRKPDDWQRDEHEIIDAFRDAMAKRGLYPPERIEADGRIHRCDADGKKDRRNKKAGAYCLHLDHPAAGWFENHCDGLGSEKWCAAKLSEVSPDERKRLKRRQAAMAKKAKAEREERQAEAVARAARIWQAAHPAPDDHPYLAAKGVAAHGARVKGPCLVVPVTRDDRLISLQFIAGDGGKRFLKDGVTAGGSYIIGEIDGAETVLICEGFATAATCFEATGWPAVAAFNAGNLAPVARAIRERLPSACIVIAADDDHRTEGNPGIRHAEEAAAAINARVARPAFGEDRGDGDTDFNDMARHYGLGAVRARLADEAAESGGETGEPPATERQGAFLLVRRRAGRKAPGVYYAEEDEDGKERWQRICSRLEVLADTRDDGQTNWGRLLEITDPAGNVHRWAMPAELLAGDGQEMRRTLLRTGLRIAAGAKAKNRLSDYVQLWQPSRMVRCVSRVGWHGRAYVLPDRQLGGDEEIALQTPAAPPAFAVRGDMDGWRRDIAIPAERNSRLVLALAVAFAGPCLRLAGEESAVVHLTGDSSIGKTKALDAGRSVWGVPRHTWRMTDNAVERIAAAACDCFLALDELGEAEPRHLAQAAYMLGNGRGKGRMRADTSLRDPLEWRILALSTGEIGLPTMLAQNGLKSRAGQEARFLELPADAGASMGLFEDLTSRFHNAHDLAEHIAAAAEAHCGHAGPAFLERLTADLETHGERIRAMRADFIKKHAAGTDSQVQRAAGRFGVIAAASELATEWGITGWHKGTAEKELARLFGEWLAARGGAGSATEREMLAQVRHFLEEHGASRFVSAWDAEARTDVPKRAGFRRLSETGWTYYVMRQVWRSEICKGYDAAAVAAAMAARGFLLPGDGRNYTRQERIPDFGKTRFYVVTPDLMDDEQ